MSVLKILMIAAALLMLADWALTAHAAAGPHFQGSYYGNDGYGAYHR
jgi:hypothetical protein